MSINNEAIVVVGKVFDTENDIVDFTKKYSKNPLTENELIELKKNPYDFFECRKNKQYPSQDCLNLYNGDGFYIGYKIIDSSPEKTIENIKKCCDTWKSIFNSEPQIVAEVRIG